MSWDFHIRNPKRHISRYDMSMYSLQYMIPTMVGCPGHLIETQHVRCDIHLVA